MIAFYRVETLKKMIEFIPLQIKKYLNMMCKNIALIGMYIQMSYFCVYEKLHRYIERYFICIYIYENIITIKQQQQNVPSHLAHK